MDYPHTSPIILTDDIFVAYGGHTGSSAVATRQAAYLISERGVSEDIGTLLLPTNVSGTFNFEQYTPRFILDWNRVQEVSVIRFLDTKQEVYYTITGTDNIFASIRSMKRGILDLHHLHGNCNCSSSIRPWPYQIEVEYQAGLPTGTANQPDTLLALVTYADMILNEIVGFGNEAPGLVGVQRFTNQKYTEVRTGLKKTGYGASAKAQLVSKLLNPLKVRTKVKLGW